MMSEDKIQSLIERLMDEGISSVSAFAEVYAKPHIPALATKFRADLLRGGYHIEPVSPHVAAAPPGVKHKP
jgi:hypothetical protein